MGKSGSLRLRGTSGQRTHLGPLRCPDVVLWMALHSEATISVPLYVSRLRQGAPRAKLDEAQQAEYMPVDQCVGTRSLSACNVTAAADFPTTAASAACTRYDRRRKVVESVVQSKVWLLQWRQEQFRVSGAVAVVHIKNHVQGLVMQGRKS